MSDQDKNQIVETARVAATAAGAVLAGVRELAGAVADPEDLRVLSLVASLAGLL